MSTRRIRLTVGLGLATTFLLTSVGVGVAMPTVGKPPLAGRYRLRPNGGQHGTGPGSLVVRKDEAGGYTATDIALKLPQSCEGLQGQQVTTYAGKIATVVSPLKLRKFVAHRTTENEVSWGSGGVKIGRHVVETHKGNAQVSIDGEVFPAVVGLSFFRGLPAFKPVEGSIEIDLTKATPELGCFMAFGGRPAG